MKGNDHVRINEEIRAPRIRVIDEKGQVGVMSPDEALSIARKQSLDLIEIVPNAQPPVCKIMDMGKYKYEQSKKDRIQRKHQHVTQLKELRFHPNTDTHDLDFKIKHAKQFLEDGHKVKATVVFKGREITYKEQGEEVLKKIAEMLADVAKVDQVAKLEGRSMAMIFAPDRGIKKKTVSKPKDAQPKEARTKEAHPKEVHPKETQPKEVQPKTETT